MSQFTSRRFSDVVNGMSKMLRQLNLMSYTYVVQQTQSHLTLAHSIIIITHMYTFSTDNNLQYCQSSQSNKVRSRQSGQTILTQKPVQTNNTVIMR